MGLILALMALERFIIIVPSYAILIVAGATIASRPGGFLLTLAVTGLGAVIGALLWYRIGQVVGETRVEAWLTRRGGWVGLKPKRYRELSDALRNHPHWAAFIAQCIPAVRIFATFPAGVLGTPWRSILPGFLIGALGWNLVFMVCGFGANTSGLAGPLELVFWSTVVLLGELAIAGALLWFRRRHLRRKLIEDQSNSEVGTSRSAAN
jgi:alkaline phosphatase